MPCIFHGFFLVMRFWSFFYGNSALMVKLLIIIIIHVTIQKGIELMTWLESDETSSHVLFDFLLNFDLDKNCDWNWFGKKLLVTWFTQKLLVDILQLKPMHNIGKVSVNASILYKNQEICNKKTSCTNFSSFRYFFYEKTVKMHSAFLYSF